MPKVPISVAMITKNAALKLRECLESLAFADEIVIVDCGSTDHTREIALEFGARWYLEPWKGFGPQKNSAIEKCVHDWVLSIDADERVPPETARMIARVLDAGDPADAYSFRRKNFFRGRWIKSGEWWPDEVIRLLRKDRGMFEGQIHEKWSCGGRVRRLRCCIEHYSFDCYSDMIQVMDRYSGVWAELMHTRGETARPRDALLRFAWMFLRSYVLRMGFLAGFDGFMIAFTKAQGSFLKYAKLYELQQRRGRE